MKRSTPIYYLFIVFAVLILFQEAVFASENKIDFSESAVNVSIFLKMFLGLTAVVVLIFVLAWLTRKMKLVQNFASGYQIKNLASLSLTSREKICLIEVGDKQMLVGVAPGNINSLHIFENKIEINGDSDVDASNNPFSKHLKKALGTTRLEDNKNSNDQANGDER